MRLTCLSLFVLIVFGTGCSWVALPSVHKIDIQQGNLVNQEMIDKLQPGMTKLQVQFVLGTPLVRDSFDQSRWDYFYSRVSSSGQVSEKQLTVVFNDQGELLRTEGDYLPTSTE
jgi:outer membrane protein assembly factor BamE